eukprot:scaffold52118_cov74-Cyclotella_meneghiniana.AAC.4
MNSACFAGVSPQLGPQEHPSTSAAGRIIAAIRRKRRHTLDLKEVAISGFGHEEEVDASGRCTLWLRRGSGVGGRPVIIGRRADSAPKRRPRTPDLPRYGSGDWLGMRTCVGEWSRNILHLLNV